MKKATENWLKIAKRDLKVAEDNLALKNYTTTIEKCHAALEKLLKGIITENNQIPNKIHNLLKLASEAVITNLQDDMKKLFDELSDCYFSLRYPEDIDEVDEKYNEERTKFILKETKRIFLWLEKKIK